MAPIRKNPTLSDDLISEILERVPVKSLLRFQSVCKTWLSLIKHPAFVKSQLLRATTTETDQTLIISRYKGQDENRFVLFRIDSRETEVDFNFPYSRDEFKYVPFCTLVGSANGIACIAVDFINFKVSIYLWNPATRQAKAIPTFRDVHHEALGFGYDPVDDDYKVVRIVMPPSFSEVYSDNGNVWRKVPDPIDTPLNADFDVCFNGFLCGIGKYGMMAFDLNKEVMNCGIKLPVISVDAGAHNDNENDNYDDDDDYYDDFGDGIDNGDDYDDFGDGVHVNDGSDDDVETPIIENNARIIEFNKSIGVIILRDNGLNDNKKAYMWTLDDEACLRGGGVEASWTLMFSIDLEAKIVPLSVDMAKHQYRHVYKYTESLVSLAGFGKVDWNVGDDDN
ncbi:F-box domain-containing protein [Heracleum sosnowskyi]|uniref:F-box domain-containing protein n=1 Tax=Heracleum sosnowskyi TaxID=360622 RepID=A0AAD8GRS3_9APIA|nr:F-box domain-containing protein [Heracleum sosnowskyi]